MKTLRLLPIVIVAGTALTVLKVIGLVFDGGYLLTPIPDAVAAQQTEPAAADTPKDPAGADMQTASADSAPDTAAPAGDANGAQQQAETPPAVKPPPAPKKKKMGTEVLLNQGSEAERAVLERLGERRKVLEAREKEVELREQLLKAAEQRLEKKVAKLKQLESQIGGKVEEKKKKTQAKFADLVKMYESMKPKAAAKIFDRLSLSVMVPVAKQMKPRKLGDVMARMNPEAAEKLTVALATNSYPGAEASVVKLPKIEGKKPATEQ